MKKVGLITIQSSYNYGANLQCYATWKYIKEKGHHCEVINLLRPVHREFVYERKYKLSRNDYFSFINRVKRFFRKLLKIDYPFYTSTISQSNFEAFSNLMDYSRKYIKVSELYACPPVYDLYISGSDQIWNPTQPYCLEPYFLTFAPSQAQKISFASSIGITEISHNEQLIFKKWLSSYDGISVREPQAKALLDSFIDKNVTLVPDPCFLLSKEEWQCLAEYKHIPTKKYIVLFLLSQNESLSQVARFIAKNNDFELVVLKDLSATPSDGIRVDNTTGPKEFLGYISQAEMVITDSFHCCLFSILMNVKSIGVYISPTSKRGSRITHLLNLTGLNHCLLPPDVDVSCDYFKTNTITDFSVINDKIMAERAISEQFLDKWLIR